jgi:hypothetical protein
MDFIKAPSLSLAAAPAAVSHYYRLRSGSKEDTSNGLMTQPPCSLEKGKLPGRLLDCFRYINEDWRYTLFD